MEPIVELRQLLAHPGHLDRTQWTAVIPAAGKGSRLGYSQPKILYPILQKPMLHWLCEMLEPLCAHLVVVASPDGRQAIEHAASPAVQVCIQDQPRGMADAVWAAKPWVSTPYCLVLWGDQIGLRRHTVQACMTAHGSRRNALLTLPSLLKSNPYIHFLRDAQARLLAIQQAREGEIEAPVGENDCGVFLFRTQALFDILHEARQHQVGVGKQTGEFNLLPLLPQFERGAGSVMTIRIEAEEETWGVNTPEDAQRLAQALQKRSKGEV